MTDPTNSHFEEFGKILWDLNFYVGFAEDAGSHFESEGGDDEVHQTWADEITNRFVPLRTALDELKYWASRLPPDTGAQVVDAYIRENREALARGAIRAEQAEYARELLKLAGDDREGGTA